MRCTATRGSGGLRGLDVPESGDLRGLDAPGGVPLPKQGLPKQGLVTAEPCCRELSPSPVAATAARS